MVELAGLAVTATLKEEGQTVALVGGQVVKANIPRQALEAGGSEVGVAAAKGVARRNGGEGELKVSRASDGVREGEWTCAWTWDAPAALCGRRARG